MAYYGCRCHDPVLTVRLALELHSEIDLVGEAINDAEAVSMAGELHPDLIQLIAAVHAIQGGNALLAPSITRRLDYRGTFILACSLHTAHQRRAHI